MPLHPQAQALLDARVAAGIPPTHTLTPEAARAAIIARLALAPMVPQEVAAVEDRNIDGPGGPLHVRLYWPTRDAQLPVLVFMHGGGWVVCDVGTHDALCRALSNAVGCIVVSVDYRRAPEQRFPAAVEDADAGVQWAAANAAALGGDASRLAVGGDSAGGTLAAVVSLRARLRGDTPAIAAQLLIYPPTDYPLSTQSHRDNGEGYILTTADMEWYWNQYCPDVAQRQDPMASPLRANDLRGLPPAVVVTAEFDPLRDEGEAYTQRLAEAGVPVDARRFDGMLHGFVSAVGVIDGATEAMEWMATRMRSHLRTGAAIGGTA
jgi:acetyl esterase/lipase